jgi:hypothetical protein
MDKSFWEVDPGVALGPLALGLPRDEILERAAEAGMEVPADDEVSTSVCFDDAEIELHFRPEAPHRLWQMVVSDERVRFGGQRVIERPLVEIVDLLKIPAEETLWRRWVDDEALPEEQQAAAGPLADEELLLSGTLWITTLGLGLQQSYGEIDSLWLRQPADSPRTGLGQWTAAQRKLAVDPDLAAKIARARRGPPQPTNYWVWIVNVLAVIAAGWLVLATVRLQQRWNEAVVIEGVVVAVDPPPPEPFPDRVTVAYVDTKGVRRETLLQRADYYVASGIGDKMEIRYLLEAPDKPLGPARIRDIAFDFAVPRVIGLFATYLVLQLVAGVVFRMGTPKGN